MILTLSQWLDRVANWKTQAALVVLYISFPAYWLKNAETTLNRLAGKAIGPIDLTIGYDPARTLRLVADYGPAARAYYAQVELTLDLVYPLVYSLLFAVILTLIYRNKPKPVAGVALLPFVCLLFDYLENTAIVGLLTTYPAQSPALAVVCEIAKLAKWLSLALLLAFAVYGLLIRRRVQRS